MKKSRELAWESIFFKKISELENTIMLLNLKLENMTIKTNALYDSILKKNAKIKKKKAKNFNSNNFLTQLAK